MTHESAPQPFTDDHYPEDPMVVERSATPDGRLLLYFTFPKTADAGDAAMQQEAVEESGGEATRETTGLDS